MRQQRHCDETRAEPGDAANEAGEKVNGKGGTASTTGGMGPAVCTAISVDTGRRRLRRIPQADPFNASSTSAKVRATGGKSITCPSC